MSRTWKKRAKKYPKKPGLLLVAALLPLLFTCMKQPVFADDWQTGDRVVRATYSYGSEEIIPGTEGVHTVISGCETTSIPFGPELTEHDAVGLSYAYFLADDMAVEFGATVPLGNPGQENLGISVTGDYYFGRFLIPLTVGYRGDLDSVYAGAGGGYEWLLKQGLTLRLTATANYFEDHDLAERWAWTSQVAAGWRF